MQAFISSVIAGFEEFRAAAASACGLLGHEVIRAEDWPARAQTPQQACLEGVRQADVVVLLLGARYGPRQASGMSATEEEFNEATRSKSVLVFEQTGVERDADMAGFVERVQAWAGGVLSARFSSPAELRDQVIAALSDHALREQAGLSDPEQLAEHARSLLPRYRNQSRDVLAVAVASGPEQQILRPAQIEAHELCEDLKRAAMFGPHRVIDSEHGARCSLEHGTLVISNDQERIVVDPQGGVAVHVPARRARNLMGLNPIIEEDIRDAISTSLSFIGATLARIDPTHRVNIVVPVTPNTMGVGLGGGTDDPIWLKPLSRPRQDLTHRAEELAEDFTLLLRRQVRR